LSNGAAIRIAVAQIGARRHYAVPTLLEEAGLLEGLWTDWCAESTPLRILKRFVPCGLRPAALRRLLARRVEGVPREKIRSLPSFALKRLLRPQKRADPAGLLRNYARANAEFGRRVVHRGLGEANAVYVFNAAGLEILQRAKRSGLFTILDQTAAPFEVDEILLAEERTRWPGWECQGTRPQDWKPLADRERAEWELADLVLCGSQYVRDSVRAVGGAAGRCRVVPYGVDIKRFRAAPERKNRGCLRVAFIGTVCLRKGIPYVMEAARRLKSQRIEFRVVGPVRLAADAIRELDRWVELAGPVPRSAILAEYESADVLLMPSLSEGSANVCYEAMAMGLPVITTPNAGSVIRDGVDGFLVPIRCADGIAERIVQLAGDRNLLYQLSRNARARARDFTWKSYRERLTSTIVAAFREQRGSPTGPGLAAKCDSRT